MRRLALVVVAGGSLTACAGPCEDDGFGQTDCPVARASGDGSTSVDGPAASTGGVTTAIPLPTDPTDPTETDGSSGDPSTSGETGGSSSSDSSTGEPATTTYCMDNDADGFGDALDCTDVPDGEPPPAGAVDNDDDCDDTSDTTYPGAAQNEPELCAKDDDDDGFGDNAAPPGVNSGTDCIDDNAAAFPGAAELDDDMACMEDADDDGFGNSMPPAGAMAGTDCDDADASVPSASACLVWCIDTDVDQYGDASNCVIAAAPPAGFVGNGEDCDDADPSTFPGAAQTESATACMRDVDDDGFGDAAAGGAIVPGSDCDDLDANVQAGCFDCPAGALRCASDDLFQCNATGTFAFLFEDCDDGCDDLGLACWPELTVDARADGGVCISVAPGSTVDLSANAAGGDGNYTHAWTPAATLDDATAASPMATVAQTTTYAVAVTDTEGNAANDAVTVHTSGSWDLEGPGCQGYTFAHPFGTNNAPDANPLFFLGSTAMCNFGGNSPAFAWVCPTEYDDTRISFQARVIGSADDDAIGFVWGWQDAAHFYVMSWKQAEQTTPWGTWPEGVIIKMISAPSQDAITAPDLFDPVSTPNSTLLADPSSFLDQGWADSTTYAIELDTASPNHTITIRRADNGTLVATGTVTDATYPTGAVGSFDASQNTACTAAWGSACLP